jgi:putative transcriptional regulator
MKNHAPTPELLLGYAAGTLAEPVALAVAAQAAMRPDVAAGIARLEAAGGVLLEGIAPAPLAAGALERALAALESDDNGPATELPVSANTRALLPRPLWIYAQGDIDALPWRKRGAGVYTAALPGPAAYQLRLLRIEAGRAVPQHTHRGLELTLVLKGAYDDGADRFARGDMQVADPTLTHKPVADRAEECLCFAVLDAPIRFTSPLGRLANPFVKL